MSLIKCPECNNQVSEYADKCPNCGCPMEIIINSIQEKSKYTCNINGKQIDIEWIITHLLSLEKEVLNEYKYIYSPEMQNPKTMAKYLKDTRETETAYIFNDASKFTSKVWRELDLEPKYAEIFLYELINSNFALENFDGGKHSDWVVKQRAIQASKPKCPHCHSINIAKISGTERAMSVIGLGILSKKINKSFKCKNCGYTW